MERAVISKNFTSLKQNPSLLCTLWLHREIHKWQGYINSQVRFIEMEFQAYKIIILRDTCFHTEWLNCTKCAVSSWRSERISAIIFISLYRSLCLGRKDWKGGWWAWEEIISLPTKYQFICSKHFTHDDFISGEAPRQLKHNTGPSDFNFPQHLLKVGLF